MKKTYLLTPGPTPLPESVISVFAQPIVHHRTSQFEGIFETVKNRLKTVFQTKQEVLILAATGTGAIEMIPIIIRMANLPTSDPSSAGQLWNSSGDLRVSAG